MNQRSRKRKVQNRMAKTITINPVSLAIPPLAPNPKLGTIVPLPGKHAERVARDQKLLTIAGGFVLLTAVVSLGAVVGNLLLK